MKQHPLNNECQPSISLSLLRSKGFALIAVLATLTLVAALSIGFFSVIQTELTSSKQYESTVNVRIRSDLAVEMAIAQIRSGAVGLEDPDSPGGAKLAWASQPGMIRTWDASGDPGNFYKLYSDDNMIVDGSGFSAAAEAPPADWDAQPGIYTDLNAPVVRDGIVHFPIIDPRARASSDDQSVEGFDYSSDINGVTLPGGNPNDQRLPMPVQWLYVLEDGRTVAPTGQSGDTVSFSGPNAPSNSNPIVGRIAFWTDDETSKVNVNTASEGIFWDAPIGFTQKQGGDNDDRFEHKLALGRPLVNEFQRYPGHPATTSLSAVLKPWMGEPEYNNLGQVENYEEIESYFVLSPRYLFGPDDPRSDLARGSKGGNIRTAYDPALEIDLSPQRLFASVDEIFYEPALRNQARDRFEIDNDVYLDREALERSKFFLTSWSRAAGHDPFWNPPCRPVASL